MFQNNLFYCNSNTNIDSAVCCSDVVKSKEVQSKSESESLWSASKSKSLRIESES